MAIDSRYYSAVSQRPGPREHIDCVEGDVGQYVLLPGDPNRVPLIAEHLDGAREIASKREFRTFTGTLLGTPVTVTSTGIGGPSTAIAMEELAQLGAHTFLRIGTCGALQPDVHVGDIVIAAAAVRDEGTTHQYAPANYPAASSPDVVAALVRAAQEIGAVAHTGVVHTTDTFYGQHEPQRMPMGAEIAQRVETLTRLGVLCSEMETATVLVVAAALRRRAAAVLAVAGNRTLGEHLHEPGIGERRDRAVARAIAAATTAVEYLIVQDRTQVTP